MKLRRTCIRRGRDCSDGGYGVPGGIAWARQPPAWQAVYSDATYQRNRELAIERNPICHWRLDGCTGRSTQADHLVAVSRGVDNSLSNLVGSCGPCNEARGAAEGRATQKARAKRRRTP